MSEHTFNVKTVQLCRRATGRPLDKPAICHSTAAHKHQFGLVALAAFHQGSAWLCMHFGQQA